MTYNSISIQFLEFLSPKLISETLLGEEKEVSPKKKVMTKLPPPPHHFRHILKSQISQSPPMKIVLEILTTTFSKTLKKMKITTNQAVGTVNTNPGQFITACRSTFGAPLWKFWTMLAWYVVKHTIEIKLYLN